MRELSKYTDPIRPWPLDMPDEATSMPELNEGETLLCVLVRSSRMPEFNRRVVCETDEDVQEVYAARDRGGASELEWYTCTGFETLITGEEARALFSPPELTQPEAEQPNPDLQ